MSLDSAQSIPRDTSRRTYETSVTVNPGTLPSAPLSQPWVTEDNTVVSIELEIPPGHNGQTGIALLKGGTQLLPFGSTSWIIANNYTHTYDFDQYIPTRDLTIQAYNQGNYPHTFFLRMTVTNYYPPSAPAGAAEADALAIGQADAILDPLSPDALLGAGTAAALLDGSVTPADIAPGGTDILTVAPVSGQPNVPV